MSERDDIEAAIGGDEAAWNALISRYRRLVYSIPVAFGFPSEVADDVFQNVVISLYRHLPRIENRESLASWLATTTKRECWAVARRSKRFVGEERLEEKPDESREADVEARVEQIELEHALALAFERLDETCRELLSATFLEDPSPSYEEIAHRMGRPIGSLGPTRSRCIAKLRGLFDEEGGGRR